MSEDNEPDQEAQAPSRSRGLPVTIDAQATPYLVPRDTADLGLYVAKLIRGGCVPDGFKDQSGKIDQDKVAVAILAGMEIGLAPVQALGSIYIIRGTPTVWGKGAKALVMKSGHMEDYRVRWIDGRTTSEEKPEGDLMAIPEGTPIKWPEHLTCMVICKRRGVTTPFIGKFSVGQAARAGLWGNPKKPTWISYAEDMLEHKAAARVYDRGFADCLKGVAIREIVEEKDDPIEDRHVTNLSFLGAPEKAKDEPADLAQQAVAERDMLLHGLEKCGTKDVLDGWFQASEGRVSWLKGIDPAAAEAINTAYMAKLATFEVKL